MIAVDGDSVAMMNPTGVPAEHKWPHMLGQNRKLPVECFARPRSTARDCAVRMWRIIERRPMWYALMIGQWSQNHEELADFERYVKLAIEEMLVRGVRVCLVTPPVEVSDLMPYLRTMHRCATVYRIGIVDVYEHFQAERASAEWFEYDTTVPCHFSLIGAQNVLKCFTQPNTAHLCLP